MIPLAVSIQSDIIPEPIGDNWILGNTEFHGYYRVNYDDRNWRALINQLINDHTVSETISFQPGKSCVTSYNFRLTLLVTMYMYSILLIPH